MWQRDASYGTAGIEDFQVIFCPFSCKIGKSPSCLEQLRPPSAPSHVRCSDCFHSGPPKLQITVGADSLRGGIYLPRRRTILHPHNSSVIANHFSLPSSNLIYLPFFQHFISLFTHAIRGWRGRGKGTFQAQLRKLHRGSTLRVKIPQLQRK